MRTLTASEARQKFAEVVNSVGYGTERVAITKSGKNVVAVIPFAELELLELLETHIDIEEAKKALAADSTGGTSLEDLKAKLRIK